MRSSDWSSDVCSSDLVTVGVRDWPSCLVLSLGGLGRVADAPPSALDATRDRARAIRRGESPGSRRARPGLRMQGLRNRCSVRFSPSHHSRSEEHTSELQSLMRISYAVFCLKKKNKNTQHLQ